RILRAPVGVFLHLLSPRADSAPLTGLRNCSTSTGDRCARDVAMIYAGLFFFLFAVVSGLCGFSGMLAPFPAHIAQTVFASSQVLATLIFAARLLLPQPARSDPARAGDGDEREY